MNECEAANNQYPRDVRIMAVGGDIDTCCAVLLNYEDINWEAQPRRGRVHRREVILGGGKKWNGGDDM